MIQRSIVENETVAGLVGPVRRRSVSVAATESKERGNSTTAG